MSSKMGGKAKPLKAPKAEKKEYDEEEEEESTLIVVDNSWFMRSEASLGAYYNQLEAIELYCHAKLESNPKNTIGLYTTNHSKYYHSCLQPTSDVDKIMAHLHQDISYGGDLNLSKAIPIALLSIEQHRWSASKHKRLLLFVGGPSPFFSYVAVAIGHLAYRRGVAIDVVNFALLESHKSTKTGLVTFVAAADNNGNSHIKHIQPESSLPEIAEALSSYPPIIEISRASMQQVEIAAAARKKLAKDEADLIPELELLNRKGKNQAAPPPPPKAPQIYLRNKFDLLSLGNEKGNAGQGEDGLLMPARC